VLEFSPEGRVCSFCGTVGGPRSKFAGGYGAMICAECVDGYHEILHSDSRTREVQRPPWEAMTQEELLEKLAVIVQSSEQADAFVHDWVAYLRHREVSWAAIGKVFGITRQGAWERFTRPRTPRRGESGSAAS
jgi:ClpX C4-type zinc finger